VSLLKPVTTLRLFTAFIFGALLATDQTRASQPQSKVYHIGTLHIGGRPRHEHPIF
jgi:hypothetical protein